MNITEQNEFNRIALEGEIDLYNSPDLGAALQRFLDRNARTVYVDMQKVAYMDSSGLGVLISAANRLAKQSGRLILVRPSLAVLRLLEMTRLLGFFQIAFDRQKPDVSAGFSAA